MMVSRTPLFWAMGALGACAIVSAAPLDDYVNLPDAEYGWELIDNNFTGPGYRAFTLNLTSQRWGHLPVQFINPEYQLWSHFLTIVIPDVLVSTSVASLTIDGGSRTSSLPSPAKGEIQATIAVAVSSGVIAAIVENVPYQPVVYTDDPRQVEVVEDELIAIGWAAFIENDAVPPLTLARFPMTKASVRAMDAVTDFVAQEEGHILEEFVVSGASKRGWTAWTVAAVDSRVVACVPIVFDFLDIRTVTKHQFRMLNGSYSFAFFDYWVRGITGAIDTPRVAELGELVDPISFVDRYTFPVLLITTSGDQFFMPDNSRLWSREFRGKDLYQRVLANCEHSFSTGDCFERATATLIAFLDTIVRPETTELPRFSQRISRRDGSIAVWPRDPVLSARMWAANSADTGLKDFRLNRLDENQDIVFQNVTWVPTDITPNRWGVYKAKARPPQDGTWTGFFIELEFEGAGNGSPSQFYTSEVSIVPKTFPAEKCFGAACQGTLV